MKTMKHYCKPSIQTIQADNLMSNYGSTGNIPIKGDDNRPNFVSRKNTGSSWTWTDDEGDDDSWTNQ